MAQPDKSSKNKTNSASQNNVAKLFEDVERYFDEKGFAEEIKETLRKELNGAIALDVLLRVSDNLSEAEKNNFVKALKEVEENGKADKMYAAVSDLLGKEITEKNKNTIFSEATAHVLKEFLERAR